MVFCPNSIKFSVLDMCHSSSVRIVPQTLEISEGLYIAVAKLSTDTTVDPPPPNP